MFQVNPKSNIYQQSWDIWWWPCLLSSTHTHTHTHPFNGPFPGLPGLAGTRKVKPIWILLKQETVSGSGISWAICKSATRSRQITTPASHHSVFYRPDALPAAQPTASKHMLIKKWEEATCQYLVILIMWVSKQAWHLYSTWLWVKMIIAEALRYGGKC